MSKYLFALMLFAGFSKTTSAQTTSYGPFFLTGGWQFIGSKSDVAIYARTKPGENKTTGATIYWKIKNNTSKPSYVTGNFKVEGTPIDFIAANGQQLGKESYGGAVPGSKVDPGFTKEFETLVDVVNVVKTIKVTIDRISFGSTTSKRAN